MQNKKIELLAPAGDFDKMKVAIEAGADAVYLGGKKFSLRSFSNNFSDEELIKAIEYIHENSKKAYVTLNIFAHVYHLDEIKKFLKFLQSIKPDGIIISDLGVLSLANELAPDIPIHLSTQANTTNFYSINFLKQFNVKRFNLARELSFDEIKEIRDNTNAELEIFIHGAMCISYSGRCLLSAVLTNRSANLGECTHPCRWNFRLIEESRPGEKFDIQEDEYGSYVLNSKDLCLIDFLPDIIDANIDSIKIEGRMKSLNYISTVVSVYRKAIDIVYEDKNLFFDKLDDLKKELKSADNRDFTTAFFNKTPHSKMQNYSAIKYNRQYQTIAIVRRIYEKTWILLEVKNHFSLNDTIEIFDFKNKRWHNFKVKQMFNIFFMPTKIANPNDYIFLPYSKDIKINTIFRKKLYK